MLKNILVSALVGAFLLGGGFYFGSHSSGNVGANPGPTKTDTQNFLAGFRVNSESTSKFTEFNCATQFSWNPGAIATSSLTSTTVALSGAAVGDFAFVSSDYATSVPAQFFGRITGNATATVYASNVSNTGPLTLTTTTMNVCYFSKS
jgi:hypothetical protein